MQALLLLIYIINGLQFAELHKLVLYFALSSSFGKLSLKQLHQREPTFLLLLNLVLFLQKWNVAELILSHDEAQALPSAGYSGGATNPIDVLFYLT